MRFSMRSADLKSMSSSQRDLRMMELVQHTRRPPNGEIEDLNRKIRQYETSYGIHSEQLLVELREGTRPETEDICYWLMALRMRSRLAKLTARSR
jgi:hypothetical protein